MTTISNAPTVPQGHIQYTPFIPASGKSRVAIITGIAVGLLAGLVPGLFLLVGRSIYCLYQDSKAVHAAREEDAALLGLKHHLEATIQPREKDTADFVRNCDPRLHEVMRRTIADFKKANIEPNPLPTPRDEDQDQGENESHKDYVLRMLDGPTLSKLSKTVYHQLIYNVRYAERHINEDITETLKDASEDKQTLWKNILIESRNTTRFYPEQTE
jgi:hypothetical protein